ncbi:DNA cytosine methyltransferase [Burkholderia vietnamiensis]|uniref:DNA cytosine methyltransferase n=1 Tax=Burkholderia vietnamiensis TaxID=60552 RepID=UPI003D15FEA6
MRVNELELFAGVGGGILAAKLLGHRTVCAVERNPYRIRRLMQRQNEGHLPPFPIWDDVRTFDGLPWRGIVDCVSGGFPCQAYSSAARGQNVADDLWPEMRRIVADVAPRYVRAENTQRRAIDRAADDLESMGYRTRAISLSAADMGGDHIRKRYWLFAYADDDCELRMQVDAEVAQLSRICPRVWGAYPDESRMVDGIPYRMERLEATGDAQVPIVAATAFTLLKR